MFSGVVKIRIQYFVFILQVLRHLKTAMNKGQKWSCLWWSLEKGNYNILHVWIHLYSDRHTKIAAYWNEPTVLLVFSTGKEWKALAQYVFFLFAFIIILDISRDAVVEWSVHAWMFAALSLTRSNDWKILTVHLYLINFQGKLKAAKAPF